MFELTKEIQTYKYKIALILLSPPIPKKKIVSNVFFFFFFWRKKIVSNVDWLTFTHTSHT